VIVLLKTNGEGTSDDVLQDTVGAVCVDDFGNVASAVSSGGIILKQPGRLGQASALNDRLCACYIN
jgi:taspase, threonine aspartase, 1